MPGTVFIHGAHDWHVKPNGDLISIADLHQGAATLLPLFNNEVLKCNQLFFDVARQLLEN